MTTSLFKKGFTIIELLVVIAIIGILTAIITANFAQSKSKARDAKRISDIAQLQLVLEQIFDKCNTYPADISDSTATICTVDTQPYSINSFISNVPKDPVTAANYEYFTTAGTVSGGFSVGHYNYILRAVLENDNPTAFADSTSDGQIPASLINIVTVLTFGTQAQKCNHSAAATPPYLIYCVQPK